MAQKEDILAKLDSFELLPELKDSLAEIEEREQLFGGIDADTHMKRLVLENMPNDEAQMVFSLHKTNNHAKNKLNAAGVQYMLDIDQEGNEKEEVDISAATDKYINQLKKIVEEYKSKTGGRKKRKKRKTRRKSRKRKRKTKRRKKKRKTKKRRR